MRQAVMRALPRTGAVGAENLRAILDLVGQDWDNTQSKKEEGEFKMVQEFQSGSLWEDEFINLR